MIKQSYEYCFKLQHYLFGLQNSRHLAPSNWNCIIGCSKAKQNTCNYELVILWWVRLSLYSRISFLRPIVFELSERTQISDISSKKKYNCRRADKLTLKLLNLWMVARNDASKCMSFFNLALLL